MPVVSVNEGQEVSAAGIVNDVYEITFTIPGKDGAFSIIVPKDSGAVAAAEAAINETVTQVNALYGLI